MTLHTASPRPRRVASVDDDLRPEFGPIGMGSGGGRRRNAGHHDDPRWLSPAASDLLRARVRETWGIALLLVGAVFLAVLVSYHPADPSWNTAVGRAVTNTGRVHNLLGTTGAHFADLFMQTLGAGAYLLGVVIMTWGWRLLRQHRLDRLPVRLTLLLLGILLTAAALAGVPAMAGWPVGEHFGGSAGALLRAWAVAILRPLAGGDAPALATPVAAMVAAVTLIGALGFSSREWANGARGAGVLVGQAGRNAGGSARHLGHYSLSALVALGRVVVRQGDVLGRRAGARFSAASAIRQRPLRHTAPQEGSARRTRLEPHFGHDDHPAQTSVPMHSHPYPQTHASQMMSPDDLDAHPVSHAFGHERGYEAAPIVGGGGAGATGDGCGRGHDDDHDHDHDHVYDRDHNHDAAVVGPAPRPAAMSRRERDRERDRRQLSLPLPLEPAPGLDYELPSVELLQDVNTTTRPATFNEEALRRNAELLEGVLADFGVRGAIRKVNPGPVVTLYELEPAPGTKSSRVIGLADDIARSMSAVSVRVAVVPGRNVIGIEMPNSYREIVLLRELLASEAYERNGGRLPLVLGKDIGGAPVIADLARMPHLLIAGTTGSGKSVGINTMILSLLYRLPPDRCRFIMVDPKMLELSVYEGIPHLLTPVVTDPKKAVVALKWTVREMEDRYRAMSKLGVRNIEGYNARLREARQQGEILTRRVQTGFDADTGKPVFEEQPLDLNELPYIVVIVDEMADLMLVAGKDIEAAIQRLAQMARAAGIHIIMATQRPSVDVITGTIKANFPTRVSFQVTSKIDSRTILGEQGAEQLLGQGDMLFMAGGGRITRVHGPFVRDDEVEAVVRFLKAQGEPDYVDAVTEEVDDDGGVVDSRASDEERAMSGDVLYDRAVAVVCRERKASTSFVQRQLRIGYNSAARLIERMEQEGVVSRPNHAGKREVLARDLDERGA